MLRNVAERMTASLPMAAPAGGARELSGLPPVVVAGMFAGGDYLSCDAACAAPRYRDFMLPHVTLFAGVGPEPNTWMRLLPVSAT